MMRNVWLFAAAAVSAASLMLPLTPPAPNVNVCVNAGRRINVSGCVG